MRNKVTYRNYIFADPKIAVGTVGLEQSLPITELGIDTFEIEVKCPDKTILDFAQNEPIRYFHRKQQMGIYYVQSIARISPDHYAISAISTLGLLEQMDFYGGIYTGQTVEEVVSAICGNIPVIIKTNLKKIKLYGWLGISSARRALQQVLFAIGANLSTDNNGVLRIENLWDGISAVIPVSRIYIDGNSVEKEKTVTAVTVLEHQYIIGTERKDLFEGTTMEGQRIPFSEPVSQLQAEGFTILESGANYAVVSAGIGKLTGCPYIHTTLEVTKPVTNAPIKNEERIEDATLVSLVNSNVVVERMAEYYKCRETITTDVVLQRERPGQVVSLYHPYDKKMVQGTIETIDIDISSILKGSITILEGFRPPQSSSQEYYDERIVLNGKGSWVPPEGVTEITVVCIEKGKSGLPGEDGEQGGDTTLWVTTDESNKGGTWQQAEKDGGNGGASGEGGEGGRVIRQTISVEPGVPITYDATGEVVVFGAVSSENGTSSEAGFADVITGEILAAKGKSGISGAKGGRGGKAGNNVADSGEKGEDIEEWVGGDPGPGDHSETNRPDWTSRLRRGGGGGGGAAKGNNGEDGKEVASPWSGPAGDGADAIQPERPTTLGTGGHGGHGGGGGGGAGGAYAYHTKAPSGMNTWVSFSLTGGKGGKGSLGTEGGPSGIILYFRKPKPLVSGTLVTKDKSFFVDRLGRLIVV